MADRIRRFTDKRQCWDHDCISRAYQIVQYGHETANSLLEAFHTVKGTRRGTATDEEQDILRAVVVFAGACIDSCIKQLFKDCLPALIRKDEAVRGEFAKFTARRLKQTQSDFGLDITFLSQALTSSEPLTYRAESYVYHLAGVSLLSADQLFAACKALGLDPHGQAKLEKPRLQQIFDSRHQIVHEMDIDFLAARRNRFQRTIEDSINMANDLLEVSQRIVELVYENLTKKG